MRQAQLARLLGVSHPTLSLWESGRADPSIERLPDIAKALQVDLEGLVKALIATKKQRRE